MDYLPKTSYYGALLKVPCLCNPDDYDGLGFEGFPSRRGWRITPEPDRSIPDIHNVLTGSTLSREDGTEYSDSSAGIFIQSWLFFGLLCEALKLRGIDFHAHDFMQNEADETTITSVRYPEIFNTWMQKATLPRKEERQIFKATQDLLVTTMAFTSPQFTEYKNFLVKPPERRIKIDAAVEISIFVLVEFIDHASRMCYFKKMDMPTGADEFHISNSLIARVKGSGYCPSELSTMGLTYINTTQFFASTLQRQALKVPHSACTTTKCFARQVVSGTYVTRHAAGCEGCEFLGVDEAALSVRICKDPSEILSVDISGIRDSSLPTTLEPVANAPYVAISHVWADGLGNEKSNSLPICQLKRLKGIIQGLQSQLSTEKPLTLWIDTLSVPSTQKIAKRHVLKRLVDIYKHATAVLVLDPDLFGTDISCTVEEKLVRISLCGWTRRLWTLEEGMIAPKKLHFQFSGGTFRMPKKAPPSCHRIADAALALYNNLLPDPEGEYASGSFWDKLLFSIKFRSTSRRSDESICFSHIFGLDVSELVAVDDADERQKMFYDSLAKSGIQFPPALLFTHERKLPITGYRWAPASFLDLTSEDIYAADSSSGKLTKLEEGGGLRVPSWSRHRIIFEGKPKKVVFFKIGVVWYAMAPRSFGLNKFTTDNDKIYYGDTISGNLPTLDLEDHWGPLTEAVSIGGDTIEPQFHCLFLCSGLGNMSRDGLLLATHADERFDKSSTAVTEIIMHVDVFELQAGEKNIPIQGITGPILGIDDTTIESLGVEMEKAYHKYFQPEYCSLATFTQLNPERQWIIM